MTLNTSINEFKEVLEQCILSFALLDAMESGKRYELKELKRRTGFDKAQLSRWLSKLRKYEIVESETSSEDKRLKFFKLTKKGELLVEKLKILRIELEKIADKEERKKRAESGEFELYLKLAEEVLNASKKSGGDTSGYREKLQVLRIAFNAYLERMNFWDESLENLYNKLLEEFGRQDFGDKKIEETLRVFLNCLIDAAYAKNEGAMNYIFGRQKDVLKITLSLGLNASRVLQILIEKYWKGKSVEELRKYVKEYEKTSEFPRLIFSVRHICRILYEFCGSKAEEFFLELLNSELAEVRQLALEAINEILYGK